MIGKTSTQLDVVRREIARAERLRKRKEKAKPRRLTYVNDYEYMESKSVTFDGNGLKMRSTGIVVPVLSSTVDFVDVGDDPNGGQFDDNPSGPQIDPQSGQILNRYTTGTFPTTDWVVTQIKSITPIVFAYNPSGDVELRYTPANDPYLFVFGG